MRQSLAARKSNAIPPIQLILVQRVGPYFDFASSLADALRTQPFEDYIPQRKAAV